MGAARSNNEMSAGFMPTPDDGLIFQDAIKAQAVRRVSVNDWKRAVRQRERKKIRPVRRGQICGDLHRVTNVSRTVDGEAELRRRKTLRRADEWCADGINSEVQHGVRRRNVHEMRRGQIFVSLHTEIAGIIAAGQELHVPLSVGDGEGIISRTVR
jgi:hypothetical protein